MKLGNALNEGTRLQVRMALDHAGLKGEWKNNKVYVKKSDVKKAEEALKGKVWYRGKTPPGPVVAEGVELDEAKILKKGAEVKVMHPARGKGMVTGKIVRYEKGDKSAAKAYIVAIPDLARSEFVPAHKIEEGIDIKKASMKAVIKDFQDSDAPQFKGKSAKKRREMAIAAKLST